MPTRNHIGLRAHPASAIGALAITLIATATTHATDCPNYEWLPQTGGAIPPLLFEGQGGVAFHPFKGEEQIAVAYTDLAGPGVFVNFGGHWAQLGSVSAPAIHTIQSLDPDGPGPVGYELYITGSLALPEAPDARSPVRRWASFQWATVGDVEGDYFPDCTALTVHDPDGDGGVPPSLYAVFRGIDGINALHRLDGDAWTVQTAIPDGMEITKMASADLDGAGAGDACLLLLAAGDLSLVCPDSRDPAAGLLTWTPTAGFGCWVHRNDAVFESIFVRPAADSADIYLGGAFASVVIEDDTTGSSELDANAIVRWSASQWGGLAEGVSGGSPPGTVVYDITDASANGIERILVGGDFTTAGTIESPYAAFWDGSAWSAAQAGLDAPVRAADRTKIEDPPRIGIRGPFTIVAEQEVAGLASYQPVPPIAVTDDPQNAEAAVGGDATFTVGTYGGGELTYQWRHNEQPIADDDNISGATSATLAISPVLPAHAGDYDVIVSDGCDEVVSSAATLTVTLLGDLNGDGVVNGADLGIMLGAWGNAQQLPEADLNADGLIDGADLGILLANWTAAPG